LVEQRYRVFEVLRGATAVNEARRYGD
jgi:hypothetical protein